MDNTLKRTITGAAIVGIIVVSLLFSEFIFIPVMLFVMLVCLAEFYKMTMPGRFKAAKGLAVLASLVMFMTTYAHVSFGISTKLMLLSVIPLVVIMIAGLYIHDADEFDSVAYLFTSQVYIAIPFSLTNLLVFDDFGNFNGMLLLGFFIIVWASDVGAFLFGMSFGQKNGHKLFPSISPKKSWEGLWGAVILTLILFVFSVFGDLVESKLKRHFDIKDSGKILPGHGGMLDRFDGALLAFPAGTIFLIVFNFI